MVPDARDRILYDRVVPSRASGWVRVTTAAEGRRSTQRYEEEDT